MNKNKIFNILGILIVSAVLSIGMKYVFAQTSGWTPPSLPPPNGNVAAPLNIGSGLQIKDGSLELDNSDRFTIGFNLLRGNAIFGGNVGIGTTSPNAKLQVNGTVKIVDGTQATGRVLTSDANGLASWSILPSNINSAINSYSTVYANDPTNLTWISTPVSLNIIPTSTKSKFIISASIGYNFYDKNLNNSGCFIGLFRDSIPLLAPFGGISYSDSFQGKTDSISYIDVPNTSNNVNYNIKSTAACLIAPTVGIGPWSSGSRIPSILNIIELPN